jgi:hypothetical protein
MTASRDKDFFVIFFFCQLAGDVIEPIDGVLQLYHYFKCSFDHAIPMVIMLHKKGAVFMVAIECEITPKMRWCYTCLITPKLFRVRNCSLQFSQANLQKFMENSICAGEEQMRSQSTTRYDI